MAVAKNAIDRLLRAAAEARTRAYAPYSGFAVGAAVLANGRVYSAVNVENSAFPLSVCAERNAVAAAVSDGARGIDAIAVVGGDARPTAPCGGCRQVLAEFARADAPVVYATRSGERVSTTVGALLPDAFGAADLKGAPGESRGSRAARAPGRRRSATRARGSRTSGR
jgi:cytidine deaminase